MGKSRKDLWHVRSAFLFILPGFLLFLLFNLYPIIHSTYLSMTDTDFYNITKTGVDAPQFIGIKNFSDLVDTPFFYRAIGLSLLFAATSVPLKILVGLLFASILNSERVYGKPLLRSLAILPWVVPFIFSILMWRGMFSLEFGAVNQIFASIGLPAINWLFDATNAFIVYNIVEVWLAYPFIMTVVLGAMQNIPPELHESAMMDGAGMLSRMKKVTLPLIKRPLIFATILTSLASIGAFMVPFLINAGGPGRANEMMMVYGYKEAFLGGRYGYAAAFMVIAAIIYSIFIILSLKATKLTKEG